MQAGFFLIVFGICLIIRLVLAYSIAKRGNMIVSAKGINPADVHIFSMAVFITLFFGVLIGYIMVFWFASAFPSSNIHKIEAQYGNDE
jgi:hypothetical protein